MKCTLFNFKKRINSTKLVTGSGLDVDIRYKESTDIHNPTITFSSVAGINTYNYAKIDDIYYFVETCRNNRNNIWELTLRIDLLATYRSDILGSTAFVTRSGVLNNPFLLDGVNQPSTKSNYALYSDSGTGIYETGEGCFILQTLNSLTSNYLNSYQSAYILTAEQVRDIASALMTDSGVIAELKEIFSSPTDAIVRLTWLPLSYDVVAQQTGGLRSKVYIGAYDTEITGYIVGSSLVEYSYVVSINHDNINNYLSGQQYNSLIANIPFVGVVPLDGSQIIDSRLYAMQFRVAIDVRSSKQLVTVCDPNNPNQVFNVFETSIGVECALSSANTSIDKILNNVAMSIPMIASGTNPAYLAPSMAGSVSEAMRTVYNAVGTTGGNAFIGFATNIRVIHITRESAFAADNVNAVLGRPYNKVALLADCVGGYCLTVDASVGADCYGSELTEINQLLNGGVYLE